MPDIFDILARWWKRIALAVLLAALITGVWEYMQPDLYLAKATAVPASIYNSDKAKIFGNNIQSLYPALGGSDELDLVLGTAALDTVYIEAARQTHLAEHYHLPAGDSNAVYHAAQKLKGNTRVIKSDYGELQVKVWDTDKAFSAELANDLLNTLARMHQDIRSAGDQNTLQALTRQYSHMLVKMDSVQTDTYSESEIKQYEELIHQYTLLVNNKPPVLVTVEKARAPLCPDKPKRLQTIAAAAFLALVFFFLLALLFDRKKTVA